MSTSTATPAVAARPARRSLVAPCVAAALAAALTAVVLGFALGSDALERWLFATRFTARVSFPIFVLAFTASSNARLFPSAVTRGLLRARRGLGLGFALAHTVHLAALTTYSYLAGREPGAVTLIFGGGAYLLMFLMAATSNDRSQRRLGRNWNRLHTAGAWWLWFIFAQSYAGRVAGGQLFFLPQVALVLGSVGLRIAAWRVKRR